MVDFLLPLLLLLIMLTPFLLLIPAFPPIVGLLLINLFSKSAFDEVESLIFPLVVFLETVMVSRLVKFAPAMVELSTVK